MARNELVEDDIVSVLFTATADVTSIVPGHRHPRDRLRRRAPALRRRDRRARRHAPVHPGAPARPHHPAPATRSTTSTSTVPKGSAMTSPTEGGARRRALVVGTGLIGGSIALGLRRRGWHVSGVDADEGRRREALERGRRSTRSGDDPEAEVVFVADPGRRGGRGGASASSPTPRRRPDAVVTDVSGVKTAIVADGRPPALHRRPSDGRLGADRPARRRPRPLRGGGVGADPDGRHRPRVLRPPARAS